MAFNLEDFNGPALSLGDFKGQPHLSYTPNEKSASMVAASQAASTGAKREDYDTLKSRMLDPTQQEVFILEQQKIRDALWEDFVNPGAMDIVADPSIPVETKDATVSMMLDPSQFQMPVSTMSVLAYTAARADMDENATEAAEQVRYKFIDSITSVNEQKRQRQAAINSLELGKDQGVVSTITDFAELMTPFAEWIHIDRLQKEVTGSDKGWAEASEGFLLGQQKQNLYDQIKALPMEERAEFTERLLEIVQNNSQVVLPDGNDMVALETLNQMLIDNDYSNFERWFDNATSILDMVGLGGVVRGATGARAVNRATTLEDEARAFSERPSESLGPLADEAAAFKPETENLGSLGEEAAAFKPAPEDLGPLADEAAGFKPEELNTGSLGVEASEFKAAPEPTAEDLFGAMAESTRTAVSPTSPSQVVKDVNPQVARDMHDAAMADETGEFAKAVYGTDKTEAAAKDILPEPDIKKGKMENKVEMKPQFEEPENVKRARRANGNIQVTDAELAKVRQRLNASFENVEGMALHPSSLVVRTNLDGTIGVTGRYSPIDSGFKSWTEAVDNAQYAFRSYGLQADNFVPLVRQGDSWIEMSPKDVLARQELQAAGANLGDIDYAVGLKFDYRFRPEDLEIDEVLSSSTGLLAKVAEFGDNLTSDFFAKLGQGSIKQNVLDPASVIHPQIVNAAYVAIDRAYGLKKLYIQIFEDFAKGYQKMPTERRAKMADYIHEANRDGVPLSTTDLYARGFSTKEIEMLKQWRRANDAMWYAANEDMVKTLRSKGFKTYYHKDSDTKLVGKPVKRQAVGEGTEMFDSVQGVNITMSKQELDDLYNGGGEVMRLDEPIQIDGNWIEYVKVRNTPNGGYTRSLYDSEVVMPYRDGYYPVMYDANYFIEKHIKRKDGTVVKKVVASARDSKEVSKSLDMLRSAEPDAVYVSRKDRRLKGDELFDEGAWNTVTNGGMTSQRVRGQRLGDAGMGLEKMGHAHLKDPLEAVANQIHQLSQRVSTRTFLETTKNRWMQNYSQYLDLPKNKYGQVEFPKSLKDIKGKEGVPPRVVADAKTNFNYLYSLQNGYINYIDEAFKGGMQYLAEWLGEKGWAKSQRALFEASKGAPTRAARATAFKLFISMNPARQAIIQRGQMLQFPVMNPTYATTGLVNDLMNIRFVRVGLSKDPKYTKLYEEIKDQGILEAVDAHVLIREDAMRLADLTAAQRAGRIVNAPVDFLQLVGFDAAERDILISAWLTFRDLAIKAGKNVDDQRVKDEILAKARSFTGGMNRAGDTAYSQNTASMMMQFFSFRHKMLLQTISNRDLTGLDKAKLLAFNVAMFGPDAALISYVMSKAYVGKPSEERDIIEDGLLDTTLNWILTQVSGQEQAIDWGDFAPTEAYGMGNMFIGMLTTNLGEMIASSPSGSLFFGANPRLTDAFKTGLRYFNVIDDYEDPELQTKFTDVALAAANMFSGLSNAFKARYAAQTGKKMSTSGNISDEDVTALEAYMASLGFQTKTETGYRKAYEQMYGPEYKRSGGLDDDVKQWYKELKRQLARRWQSPQEANMIQRVMSEAWRVFGEEREAAIGIVMGEIQKDAKDNDFSMLNGIMKMMGIAKEEDIWKVINRLPDGDVRDQATAIMNSREGITSGD